MEGDDGIFCEGYHCGAAEEVGVRERGHNSHSHKGAKIGQRQAVDLAIRPCHQFEVGVWSMAANHTEDGHHRRELVGKAYTGVFIDPPGIIFQVEDRHAGYHSRSVLIDQNSCGIAAAIRGGILGVTEAGRNHHLIVIPTLNVDVVVVRIGWQRDDTCDHRRV